MHRWGAMNAELECIACNVKRVVIQVTLVARGYEMRSLECPQCSNLLRLLVRHRRPYSKTFGRRIAEAASQRLSCHA
jgi:hypothetical protein